MAEETQNNESISKPGNAEEKILTELPKALADTSYHIKPTLEEKFKEIPVKEIIRTVMATSLTGKVYEAESVKRWTINIANEINERVVELRMKRYKHIVQVIIGELKGAGVKSGVRCVWDSDTDSYTSEIFMNDSIFCVTTVFAIFLY